MNNRDALQMLDRVQGEIQALRHQVAELAPKAEAYDALRVVLGLIPQPSQGYGEDILWVIKQGRTKLEQEIKDEVEARAKSSRDTLMDEADDDGD